MAWTEREELICVATDGRTIMFNVFGEKVNDFTFQTVSRMHAGFCFCPGQPRTGPKTHFLL